MIEETYVDLFRISRHQKERREIHQEENVSNW